MHHLRFKGLGYIAIVAVVGSFLILRPLFEILLHESDSRLRTHVNGTVLALSGIITLAVACRANAKNGVDIKSKRAWTSELFESKHVSFSLPMRLFGVMLIALSFLF